MSQRHSPETNETGSDQPPTKTGSSPSTLVGTSSVPIWLALALAILNMAALALALELTKIHIYVHLDPATTSFCSLAHQVSCLNVAESRFAVFAGVPVSVWALIAHLALVSLIWPMLRRRPPFGLALLTLGAWIGVGISVIMAAISGFILRSLCLLCAGLGLVNLALALASTWTLKKSQADRTSLLVTLRTAIPEELRSLKHHRILLWYGGLILILSVSAVVWYPKYWEFPPRGGPGNLAHGFNQDGSPWIGAENPQIVIEEFTDFECPFCRKAHDRVRTLLEHHGTRVRLVHRDFPLDHHCNPEVKKPYHLRACILARAARCAGKQHKYWHMADMIFARQPRAGGPDVTILARRLGLDMDTFEKCMDSRAVRNLVRADIDEGNKRHVDGTPTYFINGQRIPGWPNEAILSKISHSFPHPRRPHTDTRANP